MATATVYIIEDGFVVEQFDSDYNYAIGVFWGKPTPKGKYYVARKGVKIPYPQKRKILKSIRPLDREQSH